MFVFKKFFALMGGQIQEELLMYLSTPALIDNAKLRTIVYSNRCAEGIAEGLNGITYKLGTDAERNCNDFVLVKIAKERENKDWDTMLQRLKEEASLQLQLYNVIKVFDDEGTTTNAKMLIPKPIKLQDEFFFMQYLANTKTFENALTDFLTVNPSYFVSVLLQVASFFAMIETRFNPDFRHGDLHMSNILISNVSLMQMKIGNATLTGFFATVIDFGYSGINKTEPLDVVRLLMILVFRITSTDPALEEYIDIFRGILWNKVLLPLFKPFLLSIPPDYTPHMQMAVSRTNFEAIINYFKGRKWMNSAYEPTLQAALMKAGYIVPSFNWQRPSGKIADTTIVLTSMQVADLLMDLLQN
jgi:hypothetical protein